MIHRNIITDEWSRMAIDSLYSRGQLHDWQEFFQVMRLDPEVARSALIMAERHEDTGSAALARYLVGKYHPALVETSSAPL